eukprot:1155453-Pelagomonas_calceolata.AAC.4
MSILYFGTAVCMTIACVPNLGCLLAARAYYVEGQLLHNQLFTANCCSCGRAVPSQPLLCIEGCEEPVANKRFILHSDVCGQTHSTTEPHRSSHAGSTCLMKYLTRCNPSKSKLYVRFHNAHWCPFIISHTDTPIPWLSAHAVYELVRAVHAILSCLCMEPNTLDGLPEGKQCCFVPACPLRSNAVLCLLTPACLQQMPPEKAMMLTNKTFIHLSLILMFADEAMYA